MEIWKDCSPIKERNGRQAVGRDDVRVIWKEYFEGLYDVVEKESLQLCVCDFDGAKRGNYFGEQQ